jgi:putative ABC transport system permease protein
MIGFTRTRRVFTVYPFLIRVAFKGKTASNHPATGPAMKAEFPEVVDFARVVRPDLFMNASTISYNDGQEKRPVLMRIRCISPIRVFSPCFHSLLLEGDPRKALSQTNAVVISKTTAQKYFGKEKAIGKTIYLNKNFPLKVNGVLKMFRRTRI